MSEPLDLAAHFDGLSADERDALQRAILADPTLGRALSTWRSVRDRVGAELDSTLPDNEMLVLMAVGRAYPSLLDDRDRQRIADATVTGSVAQTVVNRLDADARAFAEVWEEHVQGRTVPDAPAPREAMRRIPGRAPRADRPAERRANVTPLWSRVGRLAAVFALISLGVLASYLWRRDAGLERIVASEAMTLDLPDGSSVELAAASELLVPEGSSVDTGSMSGESESDAPRFARLVAGRALFRVARSTEPFVVETPVADVTVLGTTFGVTASSRETDVVLVSGSVDVASRRAGDSVRLEPGQRTAVRAGEQPAAPAVADMDAALAWTGELFIRSEPLDRAAARIASAFGVQVSVDSALATEAVTGSFDRSTGAETALEALAMAVDGRLEGSDGTYRIVRAND